MDLTFNFEKKKHLEDEKNDISTPNKTHNKTHNKTRNGAFQYTCCPQKNLKVSENCVDKT